MRVQYLDILQLLKRYREQRQHLAHRNSNVWVAEKSDKFRKLKHLVLLFLRKKMTCSIENHPGGSSYQTQKIRIFRARTYTGAFKKISRGAYHVWISLRISRLRVDLLRHPSVLPWVSQVPFISTQNKKTSTYSVKICTDFKKDFQSQSFMLLWEILKFSPF
jgi:hypothetical protein